MAVFVTVTLNTKPLASFFAQLGRRAPIAMARAVNKTADSEKTALSGAVAKDMGIKVSVVKAAIRVERATANRPLARVIATGRRIARIDMGARGRYPSRGRGTGVSYVTGEGGRTRVPDAFIATMPSGHRGVFKRSSTKVMRVQKATWKKKRPAIFELMGPSVAVVFRKLVAVSEPRRNETLMKKVEQELNFELLKLKAS